MAKEKNIKSGHVASAVSAISNQQIKEVLRTLSGHHYSLSRSNASPEGNEQIFYLREYNDSSCQGAPIAGCIIHFTQEMSENSAFYQITGINDSPALIGGALECYFAKD